MRRTDLVTGIAKFFEEIGELRGEFDRPLRTHRVLPASGTFRLESRGRSIGSSFEATLENLQQLACERPHRHRSSPTKFREPKQLFDIRLKLHPPTEDIVVQFADPVHHVGLKDVVKFFQDDQFHFVARPEPGRWANQHFCPRFQFPQSDPIKKAAI